MEMLGDLAAQQGTFSQKNTTLVVQTNTVIQYIGGRTKNGVPSKGPTTIFWALNHYLVKSLPPTTEGVHLYEI